ncbi:MAG: hypothetical protein H6Q33_781 [Deltaproteobacteria bacterium]|jgi:hypothetical protein|nr:hypothetical protein [Deltaproteobacteria bacterium]
MKRTVAATTALAAAAAAMATAAAHAGDVGVSISVDQPGIYGRIDIGTLPPPLLVYPEPVVIEPAPVGVVLQPIYLHVPPGHAKHWGKHCRKYNACGQPVYFVRDDWYDNVYAPHLRGDRDDQNRRQGNGHGKPK